jgi:hypothetical protein
VNSHWLIPSLGHFFLALATSWKRHVLLYAHSKYGGICSIFHVGAQSYTTGLYDENRSASAYLECA